jgi:hypothetical protein
MALERINTKYPLNEFASPHLMRTHPQRSIGRHLFGLYIPLTELTACNIDWAHSPKISYGYGGDPALIGPRPEPSILCLVSCEGLAGEDVRQVSANYAIFEP